MNVREVHSLMEVDPGEELTINYSKHGDNVNRTVRRSYLKENFHFDCWCSLCDKTDLEIQKEEEEQRKRIQMLEEQQRLEEDLFLLGSHLMCENEN